MSVSKDVLATIKHLESDISTIVGYAGPSEAIAKEAAKKISNLIATLDPKPEAEKADPAPAVITKPAAATVSTAATAKSQAALQ